MSSITTPVKSSFRRCSPLITATSELLEDGGEGGGDAKVGRPGGQTEFRRGAMPHASTATIACRHTAPMIEEASTLMRRDAIRRAHRATSAGPAVRRVTGRCTRASSRTTFDQDNVSPVARLNASLVCPCYVGWCLPGAPSRAIRRAHQPARNATDFAFD